MSPQVETLVQFLNSLPIAQQEEMAEQFLEEAKQIIALPPRKNRALVEAMIQRVDEQIEAGKTMPLEEFLEKARQYNKENK
jgi:hypothetical protein